MSAGAREQTQRKDALKQLNSATVHFNRFLSRFIEEALPADDRAKLVAQTPAIGGAYVLGNIPEFVVGCRIPVAGGKDSSLFDKYMGYLFTAETLTKSKKLLEKNTAAGYYSTIANFLRNKFPNLTQFITNESRNAHLCTNSHYNARAVEKDEAPVNHHIPLQCAENRRLCIGMFTRQDHEACALQAWDRDVGR
jgi:hypothetical protein